MRAIVAFEPGFDFPFPEGDVPPPMTLGGRELSAITVPQSDFTLLTKIPIVIYYGDNIPEKPSVNPGQEQWRVFFEMERRWRDLVNRRGGDVTLVHLPKIGIRGNTHFPMSDLNNVQIADQVSKFLSEEAGVIAAEPSKPFCSCQVRASSSWAEIRWTKDAGAIGVGNM